MAWDRDSRYGAKIEDSQKHAEHAGFVEVFKWRDDYGRRDWRKMPACIECGAAGGPMVLMRCAHGIEFVVHAAGRCARVYKGFEFRGTGGVIERWIGRMQSLSSYHYGDGNSVCAECGIFPTAEDPPEEKQIEVVKEEKTMATDTKDSKKESLVSKLTEIVKDEGQEVLWRTGASTFAKAAQAPIFGMLKRQRVNVVAIKGFVETPIGEGIYEFGLGCVVPHIPGLMTAEIRGRIGRELRIGGLHTIGKQLSGVLLEPLNGALEKAFAGELGQDAGGGV